MELSLRNKLVAGLAGTAVIGGLVFAGAIVAPALVQATMASEPAVTQALHVAPPDPGAALSTSLAKFDGRYFAIGTEPDVSLEPLSSVTIRKIGFGHTTFVNVVTTSTGTYSTDALTSPHIHYPGIYAEPLHLHFLPVSGDLYGWSKLTGWTKIPLFSADSFGVLDTDTAPASQDGVCVTDTDGGGCR